MRVDPLSIARMRAFFGAGFIALGAATLIQVTRSPAPNTSKVLGVVLALGLVGLGVARIVQYVRTRGAGRA